MASSRTTTPHASQFDWSKLVFGAVDTSGGKTKVEVYKDSTSTARSNRLNRLNLCADAKQPMETKFRLDSVRDDGNPDRRGLMIKVTDPRTVKALEELDETIVAKAVECSKEWFGKPGKPGPPLSEEVVRSRYKPLLFTYGDDAYKCCKIKVKTGGDYPTTLHLNDNGMHRKYGGRVEHLTQGACVVPIVSASYGIWFLGGGGGFGLSMQAEEIIVTPGNAENDDLSHFASSVPLAMAPAAAADEDEGGIKEEILRDDEDGPM